jgi:hypothetical protein
MIIVGELNNMAMLIGIQICRGNGFFLESFGFFLDSSSLLANAN